MQVLSVGDDDFIEVMARQTCMADLIERGIPQAQYRRERLKMAVVRLPSPAPNRLSERERDGREA